MQELLGNPIFSLPLTLGVYFLAQWLYNRTRLTLLNPLIITLVVLIAIVELSGTDYTLYRESTKMIDFMLGPSVVALGYMLHEEVHYIKNRIFSILASTVVGSAVGIASAAGIILLMGGDLQLAVTMQPKSVTTPIAMALSEQSGGIPSLTAVVVIIAGVVGSMMAPTVFRVLKIESRIAKGLALGTSSHGMGTVTAIQMGTVEGAISGMAIGLMGAVTALLVPLFDKLWALL